jgi:hypothetical protein
MSQPNITAERMEATYKAICWECSEEFFEGTVKEIEEWAKKNDYDLNWDEMEEGIASIHCSDCSYIYHL